MSSIIVEIAELRNAYSEEIAELEKFLKEKIKVKIDVADREITLTPSEKGEMPKKDHVKVLLKRYLHQADLRGDFRVIAGKENALIIKERKMAAEE